LNNDLQQLILLQKLDIEIRQLQDQITALPLRQAELEAQFAGSVAEYLQLKSALDEAQASRNGLEVEMEEVQQRHQKFKGDLMKSTNEREYTTAVREIDITRKSIGSMETEILKLMEQIEKCDRLVSEKTPEMEVRRQEVDRQLAALQERVESSRTQIDQLREQRPALYATLSAEARSNYDRLSRMKSGTALSEARDYSCQSCRMSLRPQVFNDIRRGDRIITCENCGRILYHASTEELATRTPTS
jgi:predicted  nucleic acid-binding Zn-ribbon protein